MNRAEIHYLCFTVTLFNLLDAFEVIQDILIWEWCLHFQIIAQANDETSKDRGCWISSIFICLFVWVVFVSNSAGACLTISISGLKGKDVQQSKQTPHLAHASINSRSMSGSNAPHWETESSRKKVWAGKHNDSNPLHIYHCKQGGTEVA